MSKNLKLATLSVAVVAGLLVAHFAGYLPMQIAEPTTDTAQVVPETPVVASTTQPQSSGEETTSEEPAIDPADVDPASIDWEGMQARYANVIGNGVDPMLMRLTHLGGFTQQEIIAFNKLHVIPFNPKVDEVCYDHQTGYDGVGPNGDGFISVCEEIKQFPEHEYARLGLDALLDLAEDDAAAAVFASRKTEELPLKIGMALQAVALSEKSGPLLELRQREFGSITVEGDGRSKDDVINDLAHRMVLDKLADVLGDPRARPDEMQPHIEDVARDAQEAEAILRAIDDSVTNTLKELAEIQRETTGSTQIWELIDA
jgi:hypothetical protein